MTRTTAARLLRTAQLGELRMACTDHVRFAGGEATETEATGTSRLAPFPGMVWIPGGTFQMGSSKHYPEERPVHRVSVDGFWMDRYPVTNDRFEQFIAAEHHVTENLENEWTGPVHRDPLRAFFARTLATDAQSVAVADEA